MKSKTELFVILARNAPTGVIFRRGPSKQVALIKWNLRDDTFEHGQWLKGRIYERRCDLSPKGDKLIYFAAKYGNKKGPDTWTAISKPPYLTALAMWPNLGAWGGGGLFESEFTTLLNHLTNKREMVEGFKLGKNVKVRSIGEYAGRGEDNPIYHTRLLRDGWKLKHEGKHSDYQRKGPMSWEYTEPQTYEKRITRKQNKYFLQMQIRGIGERQGDWYVIDHEALNETGASLLKLPRTSWADWDSKGNLLYAQHGKLFRLSWKGDKLDLSLAKELADFSDMKFESVIAPAKFRKW
jgi:hypothetical protein